MTTFDLTQADFLDAGLVGSVLGGSTATNGNGGSNPGSCTKIPTVENQYSWATTSTDISSGTLLNIATFQPAMVPGLSYTAVYSTSANIPIPQALSSFTANSITLSSAVTGDVPAGTGIALVPTISGFTNVNAGDPSKLSATVYTLHTNEFIILVFWAEIQKNPDQVEPQVASVTSAGGLTYTRLLELWSHVNIACGGGYDNYWRIEVWTAKAPTALVAGDLVTVNLANVSTTDTPIYADNAMFSWISVANANTTTPIDTFSIKDAFPPSESNVLVGPVFPCELVLYIAVDQDDFECPNALSSGTPSPFGIIVPTIYYNRGGVGGSGSVTELAMTLGWGQIPIAPGSSFPVSPTSGDTGTAVLLTFGLRPAT